MGKPNHIIQAANVFDSHLLTDSALFSLATEATDESLCMDDPGLPAPIEHWADRRRTHLEAGNNLSHGVVDEADLCITATVVSSDFGRYSAF